MTATNQILAKLLYLGMVFFQFQLCYVIRIENNTGKPKVNLKCIHVFVINKQSSCTYLLTAYPSSNLSCSTVKKFNIY